MNSSQPKVSTSIESQRPRRQVLLIILVAILASAAALIGVSIRWRSGRAAAACIENLRAINGATVEWANAKGKSVNETPTWEELRPHLVRYNKANYGCPNGGRYSLGRPPTCSQPGHVLQ